ncbi:hypothetical protein FDG2_5278 [Candidatus Protofrankia californiensis]|uniref:Uncharacterized protein n=1 Tax=Candidatus Protofrankia californiensis TaxID=1839754 RepID=A0A1C3PBZ2_9ACTN|nr:hypothetical protein FDG2_5278 [Candidatus Protofrankia californiensis]
MTPLDLLALLGFLAVLALLPRSRRKGGHQCAR